MLFLMGPRQVGKTTTALQAGKGRSGCYYYNWDNQSDRRLILKGPDSLAEAMRLERLRDEKSLLVLDEIHKYRKWKTLLKGLFDSYQQSLKIIVTGSARLDVYKAGGDSLMGRYFAYRMHPLSVAEIVGARKGNKEIGPPRPIKREAFENLIEFGGFPEPFIRSDRRFYNKWRRLRNQQLFREELRDITRIQDLGQIEVLAELLQQRVGRQTSYTSLANEINTSIDTVKRWLKTLSALYYCFPVRPWSKNISRALRKEPKYFLWDWALVKDRPARLENLVASALLKTVHFFSDQGLGNYDLFYVRDKQKREVDFLVVRDERPWFLVEVKSSASAGLSRSLGYFQEQTGAEHALQVAFDMQPTKKCCFTTSRPTVVPASSFLSQLV